MRLYPMFAMLLWPGLHHSRVELRGAGPRASSLRQPAARCNKGRSCSVEGRPAGARAAGASSIGRRVSSSAGEQARLVALAPIFSQA